MNILIFLIGVIITLIYSMSFVWEMKQEKKRKEKELVDNKYYYTRNHLNERKVLRAEWKIIIGKNKKILYK